ncbi:TetR family transcriptional regulator [Paucilactobacillus hokkaidonensis JCM 18461]|uniref:TetR family transcriptional regulator n=2 Tax=Paucilactobacillus hokkaidonensis TaxID=1193095 RepID=A0A0A1GYJ2_9LACO|nr:TetR/AcrR family transcriptional regulator [Paucilactobacillus hokkaidonensis]KRO09788.1 TetR family transcriptional regulator [Paucilactobacillus hokkaidonensis]BAP85546.1 TetR family transcriptional regulator [Paucilactobacillus hokkaidonensis JCM 18461]
MGNGKTDPRVVKTRNNLKKALVRLMRHYKIENISVQKITETAAITRGTFYLHYKDKQDFINRAMSEILDDFFDDVMIDGNDYFKEVDGLPVQVFSLQKAFKYIENEAEVFDVLLNNQENDLFFQQLYERLSDRLKKFHEQLKSEFVDLEVPIALQIAFVVSAELGLIRHWLHDGMIYTPHYMTQSVSKMLQEFSSDGVSFTDFFIAEPDDLLL